jgi:hypothetical protein
VIGTAASRLAPYFSNVTLKAAVLTAPTVTAAPDGRSAGRASPTPSSAPPAGTTTIASAAPTPAFASTIAPLFRSARRHGQSGRPNWSITASSRALSDVTGSLSTRRPSCGVRGTRPAASSRIAVWLDGWFAGNSFAMVVHHKYFAKSGAASAPPA